MQSEGRVGPHLLADGASNHVRLAKTGELVVAQAHGRFHEAASRRQLFHLVSKTVTLAAANASPVAATTGELIVGFWNPPGSNKMISVLLGSVATVSGTPGGPFYWNLCPAQSSVTAAATGTVYSGYMESLVSGSAVRPLNDVALAGMAVAAVEVGVLGGPAAIAAGAGVYSITDWVDGRIVVPPGCVCGIACHAAGTTHIVSASLSWEEVPIV